MSLHRLFGCLLLVSCSSTTVVQPSSSSGSSGNPANNQPKATTLFSAAVKNVTIEIDYATGAEPYVGTLDKFGDIWKITKANMFALFDGKKTVAFPNQLSGMEALDLPAQDYTSADILKIAAEHRQEASTADTVTFYVVFLNGSFIDESGEVDPNVLGVSVGDTGVIGMFKPAIKSTQVGQKTVVAQFVEQSTLIHEIGHAVGLVNNGIPVAAAHQDTEHGNHCTNTKCVMYWQNEGAKSAIAFVKNYVTGDSTLYGQECLGDARVLEDKIANP